MKPNQFKELIRQHQRTILISVAGVVVAGLLTTAGILAYQGQHPTVAKTTASPTPTKTAVTSATPGISATPTTTATPDNTNYLMITELGIKLPLAADIQDLAYTYGSNKLHFSTNSVGLMSKGSCVDPFGTYTVYSSAQPNAGLGDNQVGELVASINNKYIYYHSVQYVCGSTPTEQSTVLGLINPVHTAIQSAKPIQ
jgi:hypothetical protein